MSIKELGDFTRTISSIAPGTRAYIDGPHGVFSPDRYQGPGFVFIAGGVGIAPLMSILRTFATRGDHRPCYLFFGMKHIDQAAFREEIDSLAARLRLTVIYAVSDPPADWTGERGYVDVDMLRRYLPTNYQALQYFICGPNVMQDAMEDALDDLRVPGERVHTERFNFV
jgi:predicted ferric reductase